MLAIRLARMGSTHKPFYRVVVNDSRRTPRAKNVETIGFYDPKKNPPVINLDRARADYWISKGARPSETVRSLIQKVATAAPPAVAPAK